MTETEKQIKEREHQEDLQRLRGFRPIDDDFMRGLFSVIDVENLDAGQDFDELPDTYTIFITEKDFFGDGKPLYPIRSMNLATVKPFEDGRYILYVNGEYRGDDELGRLMHDFNCSDPADMNYALLAEKARYLKENPKGVEEMCKVMEDLRIESEKKGEKKGEDKLGKLILALQNAGDSAKIAIAAANATEREKLYAQYGII